MPRAFFLVALMALGAILPGAASAVLAQDSGSEEEGSAYLRMLSRDIQRFLDRPLTPA